MCKCVQKRSALLNWDLVIWKIQPLVYRRKLILICELGYVRGIMHFIIQSALLDCSFPILVCYIRLVYRTSNFQTAAIVLTSFVKDTHSWNTPTCPPLIQGRGWYHLQKIESPAGVSKILLKRGDNPQKKGG